MKILIYDCEIIKAVPIDYKNEAPIEGIEYCKGWDDHKNMGIRLLGVIATGIRKLGHLSMNMILTKLCITGVTL